MVRLKITAGIASVSLASATLAQTAPAPPEPQPSVYAYALASEEDGLLRGAIPIGPDRFGLRPADVPPGALPDGKVIEIAAQITVTADGTVATCTETTSPSIALKGVVCRAVMTRAKFLPALDRAGRRVADTMPIAAQFLSSSVRTAPMPPQPEPGGYDDPLIRAQTQTLALVTDPDWTRFHPGKAGEAVVRMTAFRIQPDGTASYYCSPLKPLEDRPSWEAACKAMEAAHYRTNPALRANELTALVIWQADGRATLTIAPPARPGKSIGWASPEARRVPDIAFDKKMWPQARMDFPVGSKTPRCRITATTGDDATDLAACRHLETLKFTAPIDVFGRKFAVRQYISITAVAPVAPPG